MKVNTSVAFAPRTCRSHTTTRDHILRTRKSARLLCYNIPENHQTTALHTSLFLTNQRTEISFSFCRYKRDFALYVMHDGNILPKTSIPQGSGEGEVQASWQTPGAEHHRCNGIQSSRRRSKRLNEADSFDSILACKSFVFKQSLQVQNDQVLAT